MLKRILALAACLMLLAGSAMALPVPDVIERVKIRGVTYMLELWYINNTARQAVATLDCNEETGVVTASAEYLYNGTKASLTCSDNFSDCTAQHNNTWQSNGKGLHYRLSGRRQNAHVYGDWVWTDDSIHTQRCQNGLCLAAQTAAHTGGAATCVSGAVCDDCKTAYTAVDGNTHTGEEILPAVAPTYTTTGLTEGSKCPGCDAILVPQEVIPMLVKDPPATGDGAPLALWAAMALLAGGAALLLRRKAA